MSLGKQKLNTGSGMTLTELLIASALVGIVTLGLVAAEFTIRTSRQSSSRESQVSGQLQATMLQLSRDVSMTVGDAGDTGIVETLSGNDKNICFREAAGDPNLYSDDLWNCWWYNSITQELISCRGLSSPPTTCNGQPAASKRTWTKLSADGTDENFYTINMTGTQINYIQLDLISRYDITTSGHAISNPDYKISSKINPAGLSR